MDCEIDARGFQDDPELLASMKDSLRRQIDEVRKQIEEQRTKNRSKALDLRRSGENQKACLILQTLSLRKELHECKTRLEEHKYAWKREVTQLLYSLQNHESFLVESRRGKIDTLNGVLRYLDFDYMPLVLRNLRASSVLLKAVQEKREVQEEETTNDRAPENSERAELEDETERIGLSDTPKVTISHAILTDDIRAALNGEVYDDQTERHTSEAKIQARLSRIKSQISKYIRGERLSSKCPFPSESLPMFDISSCDKSSSRSDILDDLSSPSETLMFTKSETLMFTRSQDTEQRRVSVLTLTNEELELQYKLEAMSPISKPAVMVDSGEHSSELSLSNSLVGYSRRSHSLVLTSPRENESLFVASQQSVAQVTEEKRPITVSVESVEVDVESIPRAQVTTPKRMQKKAKWRRWLCGCLCSH